MTLVMIFIAFFSRTPSWLWATAMVCDTILLVTVTL